MQDKIFYAHYEQTRCQATYCYAVEVKAKSFADAERIIEERHGSVPRMPINITSIKLNNL